MSDAKFPVHGQPPPIPRVFASPTYVVMLDKDLYGAFRDILIETDKRDEKGNFIREKQGKIGPISLMREAKPGEPVVAQTFDSRTNQMVFLTPFEQQPDGR